MVDEAREIQQKIDARQQMLEKRVDARITQEKEDMWKKQKEQGKYARIERQIHAKDEAKRIAKIEKRGKAVTGALKKAVGSAVVASKKAKRAYTKSSAWYKTRVDSSGEHRNPQEFEGMDSDQTGDPNVRRVGGSRFHAGGVAGYQRDPTAVGSHERLEMGFSSPLDNDNSKGQFGGASKLLSIGNGQSEMLNISNKGDEKKRKIEWF